MDQVERFIVSTGRAGSTLLSKLMAENQRVLSLTEFMGALDFVDRFAPLPIDGDHFAFVLSQTDEIGWLARTRGKTHKESKLGRYGDMSSDLERWGVRTIPALFSNALPALFDEPAAMFDEILALARRLPRQPIRLHYLTLFDWLCTQLDRDAWVERTGASFRWFPEMRRTFPDARYLHVHRDGMETALSMREHNWFVLAAEFAENPPDRATLQWAYEHPGGGEDDPYWRLYENKPPVERFGRYWSYLIANGVGQFRHLRPEQILDVRFEDLSKDPAAELKRIAAFFDLPEDPGWIERAAAHVDRDVPPRAPDLSDDERHRLEVACLPGQVLLERVDPDRMWEPYASIRAVFTA